MKLRLHLEGYFNRTPFLSQSLSLDSWLASCKRFEIGNIAIDTGEATFYQYQFISSLGVLNLSASDSQIPSYWSTNQEQIPGKYQLTLISGENPGLDPDYLDTLWHKAVAIWSNYSLKQQLAISLSPQMSFFLPGESGVEAILTETEFNPTVTEILAFLTSSTPLSEEAENLLHQLYHPQTNLPFPSFNPPSNPPSHRWVVGRKKSRKDLEQLIATTEQYLLIASYIIEDQSLVKLICQKAQTLPGGVWIITNIKPEVLEEDYIPQSSLQHSYHNKIKCLNLLLNAGANLRSGSFHLKTYISETTAYLGSCNITGGSLDFNLEAGLICQGNSTYLDLRHYFRLFWHHYTTTLLIPNPQADNYLERTLSPSSPSSFTSQTLLTPSHYRKDLEAELSKSREKVTIYSRNFNPDSTKIYQTLDLYCEILPSLPSITPKHIPKLHAKVTLLGREIAYLGGINFNFDSRYPPLMDLMYKTTNPQEINTLIQLLRTYS